MVLSTALPFLLPLIFFSTYSATTSAGVPSSVTARAAAIQHWNRVVGADKPVPPALMSHLSTMSPLVITKYFNDTLDQSTDEVSRPSDGKKNRLIRSADDQRPLQHPAAIVYNFELSSEDEARSPWHVSKPGTFFRLSKLSKGTLMRMADYAMYYPHLDFLPGSIARRIPLDADTVRKLLRIPADSPMGKGLGETIGFCALAPQKCKTRRCVTSAEDMIDYVVFALGTNRVTAKSSENERGGGGEVLIGEVRAVNEGKLGPVVSCHQEVFPYLLHHCHRVPQTRVYEAEILDPQTKEKINAATAVCHFNTSTWHVKFAAFRELGHVPGMEVCHWVPQWDFAWTADVDAANK